MARYIDAEALIKRIECYDPVKWTHEYGKVVKLDDIESAPTADVRPNVRGEWVAVNIDVQAWTVQCSNCKCVGLYGKTAFCPNCGACMRGNE